MFSLDDIKVDDGFRLGEYWSGHTFIIRTEIHFSTISIDFVIETICGQNFDWENRFNNVLKFKYEISSIFLQSGMESLAVFPISDFDGFDFCSVLSRIWLEAV